MLLVVCDGLLVEDFLLKMEKVGCPHEFACLSMHGNHALEIQLSELMASKSEIVDEVQRELEP